MTDVRVERYRVQAGSAEVDVGASVAGRTFNDIARNVNFVIGRGHVVVPTFSPLSFNDGELRIWVRPGPAALQLVWLLHGTFTTGVGGAGTDPVTISISGDNISTATYTATVRGEFHAILVTDVVSHSSDGFAVTFANNYPIVGTDPWIYPHFLSCYEMPRATLSDSEGAVPVSALGTRQAIRGAAIQNIVAALDGTSFDHGRRTLVTWAKRAYSNGAVDTGAPISTTSTSYTDVLSNSFPVLGRKRYRSDTTTTVTVKVLAWVSAGSGAIKAVSDVHGDGTEVVVTDTTPAWHTLSATIDCTDVASTDRRQTAGTPAWDGIKLQFKKNTSGTIYIASLTVYEDGYTAGEALLDTDGSDLLDTDGSTLYDTP